VNDFPIKVGSTLFTLVDPEPGFEVEYNRWYERDHFYAGCLVGPWLFAGRRWVATRALKDLRFPRGDTPLASPVDRGSYLAVYWVLEGKHGAHFKWAVEQVVDLYKDGRGFAHRTHAHTVLLEQPSAHYRDSDPVPIELALDHAYDGLAVVALDRADGVTHDQLDTHLAEVSLPRLMGADGATGSGVASMVSWNYQPLGSGDTDNAPMDLGMPPGGPERRVQMFFLDREPTEVWDRFCS